MSNGSDRGSSSNSKSPRLAGSPSHSQDHRSGQAIVVEQLARVEERGDIDPEHRAPLGRDRRRRGRPCRRRHGCRAARSGSTAPRPSSPVRATAGTTSRDCSCDGEPQPGQRQGHTGEEHGRPGDHPTTSSGTTTAHASARAEEVGEVEPADLLRAPTEQRRDHHADRDERGEQRQAEHDELPCCRSSAAVP